MNKVDKGKARIIAKHYGWISQSWKVFEEMSELMMAICKWVREEGTNIPNADYVSKERCDIIEEIADVKIMISQIEYLMNAELEVEDVVKRKLDRQLHRIEEQKKAYDKVKSS